MLLLLLFHTWYSDGSGVCMKENYATFIDSATKGKWMFSSLVSQKFDTFCVSFNMFKSSIWPCKQTCWGITGHLKWKRKREHILHPFLWRLSFKMLCFHLSKYPRVFWSCSTHSWRITKILAKRHPPDSVSPYVLPFTRAKWMQRKMKAFQNGNIL